MPSRLAPPLLRLVIVLGTVLASLVPLGARAQSDASADAERYSSRAVQERRFFNTHEFTAFVGVLPMDAFTKGITVGGSYTLHFDELVAWEVLHASYSFAVDTRLRAQLDGLDVAPTPFEVVQWYATTSLVLTPIYWKASVLNDSLLHGEFGIIVGGGFGQLTRTARGAIDVGLSARFFATDLFSVRLDVRYLLFIDDSLVRSGELKDELWIALGVSLGD